MFDVKRPGDEGYRYGTWAGNPKGRAEDKACCVAEVWDKFHSYQCQRKRGHGPDGKFCKQHAKKATTE